MSSSTSSSLHRRFTVGPAGYASWADENESVVLTRCDQSLTDDRDVVPYTRVEYPSMVEVSSFFLFDVLS
jgi:hypothetical protein